MKCLTFLLSFGLLISNTVFAQEHQIDSSEDEKKAKVAVLNWADSVFYMHREYKFDHFKAIYSDDYFIASMRAEAYEQRVKDLEKEKQAGRYKKSEDEYQKEHKELNDAFLKIKNEKDNFVERIDYILIHFWSNIQTNDGITVYYEHIIKLNNNFQVIEATVNSAIGKKSDQTQILYKKDVLQEKKKAVIEEEVVTPKENITPNNGGNGNVSIQVVTPVENSTPPENPPVVEDKKAKKKREKQEKKDKKKKKN